MDEFEMRINSILAKWNPLAVPDGLAEDEYSSYVPALARAARDKCGVRCVLLSMLEQMGLEKPCHREDVIRLSRQIEGLECQQVLQK